MTVRADGTISMCLVLSVESKTCKRNDEREPRLQIFEELVVCRDKFDPLTLSQGNIQAIVKAASCLRGEVDRPVEDGTGSVQDGRRTEHVPTEGARVPDGNQLLPFRFCQG